MDSSELVGVTLIVEEVLVIVVWNEVDLYEGFVEACLVVSVSDVVC